jgi:hypothetical protein
MCVDEEIEYVMIASQTSSWPQYAMEILLGGAIMTITKVLEQEMAVGGVGDERSKRELGEGRGSVGIRFV